MTAAKRMAHKIWNLNWNVYQRLKPWLLVIVSFIALASLLQFGWKFIIQLTIIVWILSLAFYDYLITEVAEKKED